MANSSDKIGSSPPLTTKTEFHAARDGKTAERPREPTPTPAQEKSADKVAKILNQPEVNRFELVSAQAALTFNVRAEGLTKANTTAEPKFKAKPQYKSKDGLVYNSLEAIQAAKNLDQTRKQEQTKAQVKNVTKHHAPALTLSGGPREPKRGRSTQIKEQSVSPKISGPKTNFEKDNAKLTAMQQRILAQRLQKSNQQSKQKSQSMER